MADVQVLSEESADRSIQVTSQLPGVHMNAPPIRFPDYGAKNDIRFPPLAGGNTAVPCAMASMSNLERHPVFTRRDYLKR